MDGIPAGRGGGVLALGTADTCADHSSQRGEPLHGRCLGTCAGSPERLPSRVSAVLRFPSRGRRRDTAGGGAPLAVKSPGGRRCGLWAVGILASPTPRPGGTPTPAWAEAPPQPQGVRPVFYLRSLSTAQSPVILNGPCSKSLAGPGWVGSACAGARVRVASRRGSRACCMCAFAYRVSVCTHWNRCWERPCLAGAGSTEGGNNHTGHWLLRRLDAGVPAASRIQLAVTGRPAVAIVPLCERGR